MLRGNVLRAHLCLHTTSLACQQHMRASILYATPPTHSVWAPVSRGIDRIRQHELVSPVARTSEPVNRKLHFSLLLSYVTQSFSSGFYRVNRALDQVGWWMYTFTFTCTSTAC